MAKGHAKRLVLWLVDLASVSMAFLIAVNLRFDEAPKGNVRASNSAAYVVLVVMTFLISFMTHEDNGFMKRSGMHEFGHVIRYAVILVLGVSAAFYALHIDPTPSRVMLAELFLAAIPIMTFGRWMAKKIVRDAFRDERAGSPIVMVTERGSRPVIERRFVPGVTYRILGWLELADNQLSGEVGGVTIYCALPALADTLRRSGVTEVSDFFVCAPHAGEREMIAIVDAVQGCGASCHVSVGMPDPNLQGAKLDYFGEMPVVSYVGRGGIAYRRYVKRVFDVLISLAVIIVAFIPGVILAIVIAVQSGGGPFYSQERLGKDGRHFRLYKFRSMVSDADDVEKYFTAEQLETWHRERKVDGDPRITRVGQFLRKTSLDEFPQFVNVLKGDMSLVGPRPIVDEEIRHYGNRMDEFLSIRPGLTGWWQVMARNSATYEDGTRQELELYYVRHISFTLDWNIVKRTFGAVFGGTGQ